MTRGEPLHHSSGVELLLRRRTSSSGGEPAPQEENPVPGPPLPDTGSWFQTRSGPPPPACGPLPSAAPFNVERVVEVAVVAGVTPGGGGGTPGGGGGGGVEVIPETTLITGYSNN